MKTWLTKFRISNALDAATERPGAPSSDANSGEVQRFEATVRLLDRRLKSKEPAPALPPKFHESVIRAVRRAKHHRDQNFVERRFWTNVLRWIPAPVLALLVVGGMWWALNRPEPEPQSLTAATVALKRSREMTQQAPGAVLAPLSKEMESLNRDFRSAVEFLVASVP